MSDTVTLVVASTGLVITGAVACVGLAGYVGLRYLAYLERVHADNQAVAQRSLDLREREIAVDEDGPHDAFDADSGYYDSDA